ncbi:hypothetical protein ABW19_dt0208312 [Dactylella cylindrospora]|nr:hypothetical protein ABW19_dt0208312 [Dactylella cylindrospora]
MNHPHLPAPFEPPARAPLPSSAFSQSIQDHSTKYRLRQLPSGSFVKVKIPRSERPQKEYVSVDQRMQARRKYNAEAHIRKEKKRAARRVYRAVRVAHKYIRRVHDLRHRILHARDETVELLIPLFEELGQEPNAVLEAQRLARKLEKRIIRIEKKIRRAERKVLKEEEKVEKIGRRKEGKVAAWETHIENLTRQAQVGIEGIQGDEARAKANLRRSAELWLHTHLNRSTHTCGINDRPLNRKSRDGSETGIRVRWSGDLAESDSVTIRPTESGASGEVSRAASFDSIRSSIVNIDAVFALGAEAVAEGLELDLKVVKRGTSTTCTPKPEILGDISPRTAGGSEVEIKEKSEKVKGESKESTADQTEEINKS